MFENIHELAVFSVSANQPLARNAHVVWRVYLSDWNLQDWKMTDWNLSDLEMIQ